MLELVDFLYIACIGAIGAYISGLLGVGGGIIFIPVLEHYLIKSGVSGTELVKFTLANSFFVIVFAGLVISIKQHRAGNFYMKPVIYTAIPGIISSTLLTLLIIHGQWYKPAMFKTFFLMMLIPMTLRMFTRKEHANRTDTVLPGPLPFSITGFFTGIITSLSGLGGGILMVPVFSDFLKIPIKIATSISTGVIPLFTLALIIPYMAATPASISSFQFGYVVFPLVAPLIISVVFVSPIGVKAAHRMKPLVLRLIFASITSLIILKELYQYFSK